MAIVFTALAAAALAACLAAPVLYFYGRISEDGYKLAFLVFTICWFVFATITDQLRERNTRAK